MWQPPQKYYKILSGLLTIIGLPSLVAGLGVWRHEWLPWLFKPLLGPLGYAALIAGIGVWFYLHSSSQQRTIKQLKEDLDRSQKEVNELKDILQPDESEYWPDPSPPVLVKPEKVFTPYTYQDILRAFEGRNSLAAEAVTRSYIGKWMKVSGSVCDVTKLSDDQTTVGVHLDPVDKGIRAFLKFSSGWRDRAVLLNQHEKVSAIGKIENIERHSITLTDSELDPLTYVPSDDKGL